MTDAPFDLTEERRDYCDKGNCDVHPLGALASGTKRVFCSQCRAVLAVRATALGLSWWRIGTIADHSGTKQ
ncbi:hypothetical protein [Reyranella massiliensis]|uniref:hypothetical protein n=1 Tax=Reyranella massiliensis TaxID=445220 RepID=UPI00030D66D1|nr:hypothetical protein [Reyranella massiliensis]